MQNIEYMQNIDLLKMFLVHLINNDRQVFNIYTNYLSIIYLSNVKTVNNSKWSGLKLHAGHKELRDLPTSLMKGITVDSF